MTYRDIYEYGYRVGSRGLAVTEEERGTLLKQYVPHMWPEQRADVLSPEVY